MLVAPALRRALPHLDISRHAAALVCEHRLASTAHDLQIRHGRIYGATFSAGTSYLPYTAARPVAPHMGGMRTSGFGGAAAWGASLTLSLFRHELPALTVWYETRVRLTLNRHARPRVAPPVRDEAKEAREALMRAAVYLPLAFSAWEFIFGSGVTTANANRGPHAVPWYEDLRGPGLVGKATAGLVNAANGRRGTTGEAALLGLACGLTVLNQIPRFTGVVLSGVVAGLGAVFGVIYEAGARACILMMHRRDSIATSEAVAQETREMQQRMLLLDDEVLPAPLIGALWRGDGAYERNVNFWSNVAQDAADAVDDYMDPGRVLADAVAGRRRRPAQRARQREQRRPQQRPAEAPLARDMGDGRQNVHGLGRDAAVRRSLGTLLRADAVTDAEMDAAFGDMLAFIDTLQAEGGALAQRMHPSGKTWLEAARLTLRADPNDPLAQHWPPIEDPHSTMNVDHQGIVRMKRVAAVLWRCLDRLQAVDGTDEATENLRRERKEAYVSALARSIDSAGYRLCQGGQSQRLALVSQGFVPGVQVEAYDAPAPVPQFVTFVTERMHRDLGDEPDAADVARLYDAAYLEGCAVYQGALRAQLRDQLCAVAQALYDVQWVPAGGGMNT